MKELPCRMIVILSVLATMKPVNMEVRRLLMNTFQGEGMRLLL